MKKKLENKLAARTITQVRPYDSMEHAKVDADQYVRIPEVFARKAPVPAQWGVKAKVLLADVVKGNPPEVKHQLVLTLEVSGPIEKVLIWDQECSKAFNIGKGSDHISKQMGDRYLKAQAAKPAKKVKNG